jgi:hypothetical protein
MSIPRSVVRSVDVDYSVNVDARDARPRRGASAERAAAITDLQGYRGGGASKAGRY